jgi:hypothetical protein
VAITTYMCKCMARSVTAFHQSDVCGAAATSASASCSDTLGVRCDTCVARGGACRVISTVTFA